MVPAPPPPCLSPAIVYDFGRLSGSLRPYRNSDLFALNRCSAHPTQRRLNRSFFKLEAVRCGV